MSILFFVCFTHKMHVLCFFCVLLPILFRAARLRCSNWGADGFILLIISVLKIVTPSLMQYKRLMLYRFYDFFDPFFDAFFQWVGMSASRAQEWANYSESLVALMLATVLFFLVRFLLRKVVVKMVNNTRNRWDNLLLKNRMLHKVSYLAPGILLDVSVRHILGPSSELLFIIGVLLKIYYAIIIAVLINSFITIMLGIVLHRTSDRPLPIKGVAQVLRIILFVLLVLYVLSLLMGVAPHKIFTGFGAATAVVLLIFRDTILGLVGGIQLAAYDMVREGDWISLPKHDADGTVIDISLTTVKIRNWDKTISTIPTYTLVSESVKNWRGMENSGGRRIKRAIAIDMNSVRFCTHEMLERFKHYDFMAEYIENKQKVLKAYNKEEGIDESVLINGRRQTNLGVFRAYLLAYLRHRPDVHREMTLMVRQLAPTDKGIPIELYMFSKEQAWVQYESLQSDIFDHVLAAVPAFDLQVFQAPGGIDVQSLKLES